MSKTIVNFHVPKTAGTTFGVQMHRALSMAQIPDAFQHIYLKGDTTQGDDYARLRRIFQERFSEQHGKGLRFFTGHYRYTDVADILAPVRAAVSLVSVLRDPVRRVLSDYFYSISDRHPGRETVLQRYPDLEAYISHPIEVNKQYKYLRPHLNATIDETIAFVREEFDFIGMTEEFDTDLATFLDALNLPAPESKRVNESPNAMAAEEAYEAYRDRIAEGSALDMALYNAFSAPMVRRENLERDIQMQPSAQPSSEMTQKIVAMAPWHHKIALAGGAHTGLGQAEDATGSKVHQIDPTTVFANLTRKALPDGMQGRSFLDCGCNAGGFCFAAKDAGASRTFGFDVRQHWIDQANFVKEHRTAPVDGMRFEVADLLDLSGMDEDFDVTWFSGLLYHLPDPVAGLKIAADRTRELIFVNTAVKRTVPDEVEVPSLIMRIEGTTQLMSGVHQMSWLPAGYETMKNLMHWMGFPDVRLIFWNRVAANSRNNINGRLALVAAREPGRLAGMRDGIIRD